MQQDKKATALNILLVSDIHLSSYYIQKLKAWYLNQTKFVSLNFDYVLVPGDTGTIGYKSPNALSLQSQIQSEASTKLIFEALEFFGCPIIVIPGNHDALCLFDNITTTDKAIGIHKKWYQLCPDLRLFGFGGSVPAFSNGKKQWQGYPFITEQAFKKQWMQVQPSLEQCTTQYILMTHVGPASSQTADDTAYEPVSSGSHTLTKFVETFQYNSKNKPLCLIHGHTHEGTGQTTWRKTPIINPGSLSRGNFGVLKLAKVEGDWGIVENRFINLSFIS